MLRVNPGPRVTPLLYLPKVRAANKGVVVLLFFLDTYPSLSVLLSLDVDAFLTNSRVLLPSLRQVSLAAVATFWCAMMDTRSGSPEEALCLRTCQGETSTATSRISPPGIIIRSSSAPQQLVFVSCDHTPLCLGHLFYRRCVDIASKALRTLQEFTALSVPRSLPNICHRPSQTNHLFRLLQRLLCCILRPTRR